MTPDRKHLPNDWRLRLLAYVDGELSPRERRRVESRIAIDPASRELIAQLETLSPSQRELWCEIAPRSPSSGSWNKVRTDLLRTLQNKASSTSRARLLRVVPSASIRVGIGFCALLLLLGFLLVVENDRRSPSKLPVVPPQIQSATDLLAAYDVLTVAGPEDVMIQSVRGPAVPGLVACDYPIPGEMTLAATDDLSVHSSGWLWSTRDWELSRLLPSDPLILQSAKEDR